MINAPEQLTLEDLEEMSDSEIVQAKREGRLSDLLMGKRPAAPEGD